MKRSMIAVAAVLVAAMAAGTARADSMSLFSYGPQWYNWESPKKPDDSFNYVQIIITESSPSGIQLQAVGISEFNNNVDLLGSWSQVYNSGSAVVAYSATGEGSTGDFNAYLSFNDQYEIVSGMPVPADYDGDYVKHAVQFYQADGTLLGTYDTTITLTAMNMFGTIIPSTNIQWTWDEGGPGSFTSQNTVLPEPATLSLLALGGLALLRRKRKA